MHVTRIVLTLVTFFCSLGNLSDAAMVFATGTSSAAMITTNDAGTDAIFSQPSFGIMPIDIRFVSTMTLTAHSLTSIDSSEELDSLFNDVGNSAPPTVNMFFVDAIKWCGEPEDPGFTIAGCAVIGGNDIVLDSAAAGGSNGAALVAHELGHNLGLDHVGTNSSSDNLMNPVLRGDTTLTASQVTSILSSGLVQQEMSGAKFIEVNTILVAVPEPSPLIYLSIVLAGFVVATKPWKRYFSIRTAK